MKPFSRNNWGTPGVPMVIQPEKLDHLFSDELAANLCRRYTQECVESLVSHMRNQRAPAISLAATNSLLDRAYGKPKEIKSLSGPNGGDPKLKIQVEFVDTTEVQARSVDCATIDQPPMPVFEEN